MNKSIEKFSLLYPSPEIYEQDKSSVRFDKNPELLELLGVINMFGMEKAEILKYVTCDAAAINYRADIFADILKNKELCEIMKQAHGYLIDIYDVKMRARNLYTDTDKSMDLIDSFFVINEIELYIKCVNYLAESYKKLENPLEATGFKNLFEYITEIYESEEYKNLIKNIASLNFRINNIKSVTIGANLDSQLRITNAGIVTVNNQEFKSGELLDMLLRLDMKKTEYTTIAPLVMTNKRTLSWKTSLKNAVRNASDTHGETINGAGLGGGNIVPQMKLPDMPGAQSADKETQMFDYVFLSTLNKLYSSSVKQWRPIVRTFMNNNTNFLIKLLPEIKFILKCADIMFELEEIGASLCKPELFTREEKIFDIAGLYNASLAISLSSDKIVLNDIKFDENGMIYILTGPNRGGKSVITCAIGIAQLFCQLGMLIPAQSAKISPIDCIYTHFAGSYNTFEKGRLGEECERLNIILNEVTQYSLVLLDETLSSTGSFEGSYIAAEVVEGLSLLGCKCIFSTHMHELAALVDKINETGVNKVDTLVAGMDDGERSFKMRREKPDGKSYAKDIALKFGISLDNMRERCRAN